VNPKSVSVSGPAARRLELRRQHLEGARPSRGSRANILAVARDLSYVQIDPVTVVAPSHWISLWARVGPFSVSDLDRLLWKDRTLFECWTHAASYVPTEDYPLHSAIMRRYPDYLSKSWGHQAAEAKKWIPAHARLRKVILQELETGPHRLRDFADHTKGPRSSDAWSEGSALATMLVHLQFSGEVMVVGHEGAQNLYGLPSKFLPDWVDRTDLSQPEAEAVGVQRTLRAIGVATQTEINGYLLRGRYLDLKGVLSRLIEQSVVCRVQVEGLRGTRYALASDIDSLLGIGSEDWEEEISLIPPFDNMVFHQARTKELYGFDYVREQFLPEPKRRFGTYVLPILWGDRFIGRIDPRMDRASRRLEIKAVHAEPRAPRERSVASQLAERIEQLADFLSADSVVYTDRVPAEWSGALH
jgi:uncharacterized protein